VISGGGGSRPPPENMPLYIIINNIVMFGTIHKLSTHDKNLNNCMIKQELHLIYQKYMCLSKNVSITLTYIIIK